MSSKATAPFYNPLSTSQSPSKRMRRSNHNYPVPMHSKSPRNMPINNSTANYYKTISNTNNLINIPPPVASVANSSSTFKQYRPRGRKTQTQSQHPDTYKRTNQPFPGNIHQQSTEIDVTRMNVPSHVEQRGNIVYNMVCIANIAKQIKDAMDADPEERVQHEKYMLMIREYFKCEISKFSLDWFMHSYYRKYIKLHNAMFKYIRWNAMLQSTNIHKYGLGATATKSVNNCPKLHCKQAASTKLFRGGDGRTNGPPHKKRKLCFDLPNISIHAIKREDFEITMEHLRCATDENRKLFEHRMYFFLIYVQGCSFHFNFEFTELLSSSKELQAIQQALPRLDVPAAPTVVPIRNVNTNHFQPISPTRRRTRIRNEYPLQLQMDGMEMKEAQLKQNNISKIAHHSEYSQPAKYIFGNRFDDPTKKSILDPVEFARQRKKKNISSTNCVADGDNELVPKPMPCDAMYLSNQHIMEICNSMIWRRNFLKTMDAQRQQAHIKDVYTKEYAKHKRIYTHNKHQNAEYREFRTKYSVQVQHARNGLRTALLEPISDPNIMNVIMEKAVKPFLYQLHAQSLQCEVNEKKRKRSPDDERIKSEQKYRKKNVSERVKKRLSKAPHAIILDEDTEEEEDKDDNEQKQTLPLIQSNSALGMFKHESERKLQLAAMLNTDANNDEESGRQCWHKYLDVTSCSHSMAELPHVHSCSAKGIHRCLLTSNNSSDIPNKIQIKQSNEKWKRQHQIELNMAKSNLLRRHSSRSPRRNLQMQTQNQIQHQHYHMLRQHQQNTVAQQITSKPARHRTAAEHPMTMPKATTLHAMNYNPSQYPSPHNPTIYANHPSIPLTNRRNMSRNQMGVAGKHRKNRSGVFGKSSSRKSTGKANRIRHRSVNSNRHRNVFSNSNSNSLMQSTTTSPHHAYRQRLKAQSNYTNHNHHHQQQQQQQNIQCPSNSFHSHRNSPNTISTIAESHALEYPSYTSMLFPVSMYPHPLPFSDIHRMPSSCNSILDSSLFAPFSAMNHLDHRMQSNDICCLIRICRCWSTKCRLFPIPAMLRQLVQECLENKICPKTQIHHDLSNSLCHALFPHSSIEII